MSYQQMLETRRLFGGNDGQKHLSPLGLAQLRFDGKALNLGFLTPSGWVQFAPCSFQGDQHAPHDHLEKTLKTPAFLQDDQHDPTHLHITLPRVCTMVQISKSFKTVNNFNTFFARQLMLNLLPSPPVLKGRRVGDEGTYRTV